MKNGAKKAFEKSNLIAAMKEMSLVTYFLAVVFCSFLCSHRIRTTRDQRVLNSRPGLPLRDRTDGAFWTMTKRSEAKKLHKSFSFRPPDELARGLSLVMIDALLLGFSLPVHLTARFATFLDDFLPSLTEGSRFCFCYVRHR